jgi:hypothetical protein
MTEEYLTVLMEMLFVQFVIKIQYRRTYRGGGKSLAFPLSSIFILIILLHHRTFFFCISTV